MQGISQIVFDNNPGFAKLPGAYTAKAIAIAVTLTEDEAAKVRATGLIPQKYLDEAAASGFTDSFALATAVRQACDLKLH